MADDFSSVDSADVEKYDILSSTASDEWLHKGGTVRGIVVLDYGQGDCNAIVDQKGIPVVFFDMGGGKHTGSRTHPWHNAWEEDDTLKKAAWRAKIPDLSYKPTVVLSHWDGDHYSTAYYLTHRKTLQTKTVPDKAETVVDLRWLAPRQCKHPSKLDFVRELNHLLCWPKDVERHRFKLTPGTHLVIEKCSGDSGTYDPNLDGLAVYLERVDINKKDEALEQMVLPGDAPFKYIPSCADGSLDKVVAILAFHHGSETHLDTDTIDAIPSPSGMSASIAYTFGLKPGGKRCYGHPCKAAIKEYEKKGWQARRTPSGGFKQWPPDEDDTGQPNQRDNVSLAFTAKDSELQDTPTPVRSRKIAMRRRKKKV